MVCRRNQSRVYQGAAISPDCTDSGSISPSWEDSSPWCSGRTVCPLARCSYLGDEGAEEAHREEVAKEEEASRQLTFLWGEYMIAHHQLGEWHEWREENAPGEEEAEEMEVAVWNSEEEAEAAAARTAAAKAPPPPPPPQVQAAPKAPRLAPAGAAVPAPITPATMQTLRWTKGLPPRTLPFVHFDPRVLAEQRVQLEAQEEREWREEIQADETQQGEQELLAEARKEQEEARERMEETSQERDAGAAELREAREHIRQFEDVQAAGNSLPATLPYPSGPAPQPATGSTTYGARGPWEFARQRYQPAATLVKAFRCSTTHTRRQRPKNMRLRRKSKKYKNIYDELCQKNKNTRNWGAWIFWFSAGTCRAFFAWPSCRGLAGSMKKFERYKESTRIFWFDILPGTCRGFYFCLLAGTCRTDEKSRTNFCGYFCYFMKSGKSSNPIFFDFLPRWCTVIIVLVHHPKPLKHWLRLCSLRLLALLLPEYHQ